jgi:hypothetical protein
VKASESEFYTKIKYTKKESKKGPDPRMKRSNDETSYMLRGRRMPGCKGTSLPNEIEFAQ